jgi:hypothetical protein
MFFWQQTSDAPVNEPERQQLQITLHPDGVAAPAQQAALTAFEVISASLSAFAGRELSRPEMPNQFVNYSVGGPELTSDQRHAIYESWLLAKGFQDLARGIRETLEEAVFYLDVVSWGQRRTTLQQIDGDIKRIRKHASGLPFPKLLARVNSGLREPVAFDAAFLSIQRARNCLEHRGGIVSPQDIDEGDAALILRFPRIKFFYIQAGEETELHQNARIEANNGSREVDILGRLELRSKRYEQGERIVLTARDFGEIAMACHFFASDVAQKLPTLP